MSNRFQPFNQFAKPFAIGLNLLNDDAPGNRNPENAALFCPDSRFAQYLGEKQRLFSTCPDEVFMAEADTIDAQNEVLDLVLQSVFNNKSNNSVENTLTCPTSGTPYKRSDYHDRPLALASLLVQEDLVLMRRKQQGWHLVAASLCFPSSWNLAEKFGKPLPQIHKPVPGANKKLDPMIHRIFDNLRPEMAVWRENWSLYGDRELRHAKGPHHAGSEHDKSGDDAYLRREYQTLHRLPVSRDILFTIRVLVEPLEIIENQNNPGAIATTLLAQIQAMSADEKAYKGFDQGLEKIRLYLNKLADQNQI